MQYGRGPGLDDRSGIARRPEHHHLADRRRPVKGSRSASATGFSGTATNATITTQLTPPAGLATPFPGPGQGGPPTGFSLPYTPVFYAVLTFNGTAGITGSPLEVFTVPTLTAERTSSA